MGIHTSSVPEVGLVETISVFFYWLAIRHSREKRGNCWKGGKEVFLLCFSRSSIRPCNMVHVGSKFKGAYIRYRVILSVNHI